MTDTEREALCARIDELCAEVERLRGLARGTCHMEYCDEWSGDELYPTEAYECSACRYVTVDGKPNYCPNCGAKVVEPTTNDVDAEVNDG